MAETIDHVIKVNNVDLNDVIGIEDDFVVNQITQQKESTKSLENKINVANDITPNKINKNFTQINQVDDLFLANFKYNIGNVESKLDFSLFSKDEITLKEFFSINRDYIVNFIDYFDYDLDYLILHFDCLGLNMFDIFKGLNHAEKLNKIRELTYI